MDLTSIPLPSPFKYAEWKLKMVSYIESHDILDVSFGASRESYEVENDYLDDCERACANMWMVMIPNMRVLIETVEYPFNL